MAVRAIFLLPILFRTIITDIRKDKIENIVIVSGYIIAFFIAFSESGLSGLLFGVTAAGLVILCFFPLFIVKGLGGGDIKLLSVMAAFFPNEILEIVVLSFLTGGLIVMIRMLTRVFKRTPMYRKHETIHFSVPIGIATGIKIIMDLWEVT